MLKIRPETRRSMMNAWVLMFFMFAIVGGPALWRTHQIGQLIFMLTVLPTLFAVFPLLGDFGAEQQLRRAEARKTWRAAYKASPASHYLNLHDE